MKAIEVKVYDNDLEKAMRILKKKIQNDGLFKRLKLKKAMRNPASTDAANSVKRCGAKE